MPPSRPTVPPVNATVTRLTRAGAKIWEGSQPAFSVRRDVWVETSFGVHLPRAQDSVVIPPLFWPVDPPDDPDNPPYIPPPPPDPVRTGDDGYVPIEDPPTPAAPAVGSWRELLAAAYGYAGPSSPDEPFRAAFFAGAVWEYDFADGGLHLTLGDTDGLIDRSGHDRHGNAIQCIPGTRPGVPQLDTSTDGSTWFNGVDSRVLTGWDPFADFGYPLTPAPAGVLALTDPASRPPFVALTPAEVDAFNHDWARSGVEITYSVSGSFEKWQRAYGPERHVLLSGWARRADATGNHLLFSGAGTEDIRCWVARDSNDVRFHFGPIRLSELAPRTPSGRWIYGRLGSGGLDPGGYGWPNAWPGTGQWVYWAVEIFEWPAYPPWWYIDRYSDDFYVVQGGERGWNVPPSLAAVDAAVTEDPLTSDYPFCPGGFLAGDGIGTVYNTGAVHARLWINGHSVGGTTLAPGETVPEFEGGPQGQPRIPAGLNHPNLVLLPDPDLAASDWPWWYDVDTTQAIRAGVRGELMFSGRARTDVPADLDPAAMPDTRWTGDPDPYRATARARTVAWKGEMAELSIRKWGAWSTRKDMGIRPPTLAYPGPSLLDLSTYATAPTFASRRIAGGATVELAQVIPRTGDRVTFTHAGRSYTVAVDAVEEREDAGYFRLFSGTSA